MEQISICLKLKKYQISDENSQKRHNKYSNFSNRLFINCEESTSKAILILLLILLPFIKSHVQSYSLATYPLI